MIVYTIITLNYFLYLLYPVQYLLLGLLKPVQCFGKTVSGRTNGDRAYALRRQGDSVELKPKTVRIDEIEVLDFNPEDMTMAIRVVCGKGTYIRAIARDLGRALKSGAYLTSLRRTRVGEVKVEECVDFDHFSEWLDKQIETE